MRSSLVLILTCALAFNVNRLNAQGDTVRYTIMFGDRQAGSQKIWKTADGYSESFYEFNDRGRGPEIHSRYKEDDRGYLTFLDAKGKNYLKNDVEESFRYGNGKATWKNESEDASKLISSLAFYSPINGSGGNLIKALVLSPNKKVDVLPGGAAELLSHKAYTFDNNGKPVKLYLCEIGGLGLTPNYTWADEDNNHVGDVSEWYSNLRNGYESLRMKLYEEQKKVEDAYFEKWPSTLSTKPSGIAVTNVNLFDSEKAVMQHGMTVLTTGGKITTVGKTATVKVPSGYTVIDGSGKTLMPGMWDMHVHYSGPSDGILHLGAGVTNVRDMANTTSLVQTKEQIDKGQLVGPRISAMCGFIDGAGPYAGPTGEIISSAEEGVESVKKYAKLGYPQIKLYSSIKPEWVATITAEAKRNNMRVSGHIPAYMTASEAIDAGYNEIQHINMLFLNFYGKDKDTRTPQRFTLVADNAANFDFSSSEFKSFLAKMKKNNIVSDPTVAIFEEMFTSVPGEVNPVYAAIKDRLPASSQRSVQSFGGLPANGKEELYKKSYEACLRYIKEIYDAGITIVAGTDAMPGFAYQRELELYVKAGIPSEQVLKIATWNGAKVANKLDQLGSIQKGKIADMILVNGNPVSNISDIRKVDVVIKEGVLYYPEKLYSAISVKSY
ncbi:MAG: amidohydrolase family protein [Cyclobacteriaceae bacterium]